MTNGMKSQKVKVSDKPGVQGGFRLVQKETDNSEKKRKLRQIVREDPIGWGGLALAVFSHGSIEHRRQRMA